MKFTVLLIAFLHIILCISIYPQQMPTFIRYDTPISYIADEASMVDINKDGYCDIITYNKNGCISILLGNGNGKFKKEILYNTNETNATSLLIDNFTSDNLPDIIIGNSILVNQGNSNFIQKKINLPSNLTSYAISGDFNNDGIMDVIKSGSTRRERSNGNILPEYIYYIRIIQGNGDGTFQAADSLSFGDYFRLVPLICKDFDNDGLKELLLGIDGEQGSNIYLYKFFGDNYKSIYSFNLSYAPGFYFYSLPVNDINGDGNIDLTLVLGDTPGRIDTYIGDGKSGFQLLWQGEPGVLNAKYSYAFPINITGKILDIGYIIRVQAQLYRCFKPLLKAS